MDIGQRIRKLRLKQGFKAKDFAREVNISRVYLNEIERGTKTPSLDTMQKICDALGITLAHLFSVEDKDRSMEYCQLLENAKELSPEQLTVLNDLIKLLKK